MTEPPYIGWKFGADIKQADGISCHRPAMSLFPITMSARRELADRHPHVAVHAARGEGITKAEWARVFEAAPSDDEVGCA